MSKDLVGQVFNYLRSQGMSSDDLSKINEATQRIGEDCYLVGQEEKTIFSLKEDTQMSYDDFLTLMSRATNTSVDGLNKEDMELLFNILNAGSDDDYLSYDELKMFTEDGKTITNRTVWADVFFAGTKDYYDDYLVNYEATHKTMNLKTNFEKDENNKIAYADIFGQDAADKVNSDGVEVELADLDSDQINSIAQKIANGEIDLSYYEQYLTDSSYEKLKSKVEELQKANEPTETPDSSTPDASTPDTSVPDTSTPDSGSQTWSPKRNEDGSLDYSDPLTARYAIDLYSGNLPDNVEKTPANVAEWMKNNGLIDDDQYKQIVQAFYEFSDEEIALIQETMAAGKTPEEAIELLGLEGSSTFNDTLPEETISDNDAAMYAAQLYDSMSGWGTDEEQFNSILNDPNLSAADFVKIMAFYESTYGSFIQDVDGDFSWMSGKEKIMNTITQKLVSEAENGNEDAIALLCLEFKNGTSGMTGTADEFIAAIFDQASDELLAKIARRYSIYNNGEQIFTAIKNDFSFSTEDKYIAKLNEVLAKYPDAQ